MSEPITLLAILLCCFREPFQWEPNYAEARTWPSQSTTRLSVPKSGTKVRPCSRQTSASSWCAPVSLAHVRSLGNKHWVIRRKVHSLSLGSRGGTSEIVSRFSRLMRPHLADDVHGARDFWKQGLGERGILQVPSLRVGNRRSLLDVGGGNEVGSWLGVMPWTLKLPHHRGAPTFVR